MLVSDEIFEKFETFIKSFPFEVHAVYEPDGSKIFGDCYLAAVDLFQQGRHIKFGLNFQKTEHLVLNT